MIRILFWNMKRSSPLKEIAELARNREIDILILAECSASEVNILRILNEQLHLGFYSSSSQCPRIRVFSKFIPEYLKPVFDSTYITIRDVSLPARPSFFLVAVHMQSKLYKSSESHQQSFIPLTDFIREVEETQSHSRTILVGDLNANPFEPGLVGARTLNAVMTREQAEKGSRIVQGQEYPFFYNPMWSFLGDLSDGPPGTYHSSRSEYVEYFWHLTDQVLLRPEMLPYFRPDELHILTSSGGTSFVNRNGYPDSKEYSDHLPVIVGLEI